MLQIDYYLKGESILVRTMDVVPYDMKWSFLYEQEKSILIEILSKIILDIQHFGSTSVVGLSAKPIIDIMILVKDINDVDRYNLSMEKVGYIAKGENDIPNRRYFVKMKSDYSEKHTHHIHIYEKGNQKAEEELMFRDYLRIDKDAFNEYQDLKLELSKRFYTNPTAYTDGKSDCVNRIMNKAKLYYGK
ncbi:MAG: hypothetical protein TIS_01906 [Tissierella sp.]